MIEKIKVGKYLFYRIANFGDGKMDHIFTTRQGWTQENMYEGLGKVLEVDPKKIYRGTQVHKDRIVLVDKQNSEELANMEFDGLITREKNKALVTYHADCTPVYFYDKVKKAIGLAHSGWKGSLLNISARLIEKMELEFGSRRQDIEVAIGPDICRDCYEVKEDVASLFLEKYREKNIILEKEGKLYLDIPLINRINLLEAGILEENLYISDFCTACNIEELYSYRKEGTSGRMWAGIILK